MAQEFSHNRGTGSGSEGTLTSTIPHEQLQAKTSSSTVGRSNFVASPKESPVNVLDMENSSSKEFPEKPVLSCESAQGTIVIEDDAGDVELGGLFFEDAASNEALPPEVLELQKKEKMRELSSGKNLEKLDGIWKKVLTFEIQEIDKKILLIMDVSNTCCLPGAKFMYILVCFFLSFILFLQVYSRRTIEMQ